MLQFIYHIGDDLHPILNHFPIAFLVASFLLVLLRRKWATLPDVEWPLFCWGTIMALPASVSGIMAHEAYESLPIHALIELHGLPANIGTLVMICVLVWRFRSRRKGRDIAARPWYLVFAGIGLIWIFIVGGTGGSLTYDHGVNVRGVNPLQ